MQPSGLNLLTTHQEPTSGTRVSRAPCWKQSGLMWMYTRVFVLRKYRCESLGPDPPNLASTCCCWLQSFPRMTSKPSTSSVTFRMILLWYFCNFSVNLQHPKVYFCVPSASTMVRVTYDTLIKVVSLHQTIRNETLSGTGNP
jgi:hypothetical protein